MRAYGAFALVVTVAGLAAMYVAPPQSMRTDRNGVAHFTPQVAHPETGDGVPMNTLIRHYKGE